jgi:hypothetical protein
VQAAQCETQQECGADDHVLQRTLECAEHRVLPPQESMEILPALAVVDYLHAVVEVEFGERECAHDARARCWCATTLLALGSSRSTARLIL